MQLIVSDFFSDQTTDGRLSFLFIDLHMLIKFWTRSKDATSSLILRSCQRSLTGAASPFLWVGLFGTMIDFGAPLCTGRPLPCIGPEGDDVIFNLLSIGFRVGKGFINFDMTRFLPFEIEFFQCNHNLLHKI